MPSYAVVIPARFKSSRLPGKPLVKLCGIPMIVRTYRQCAKACPPERIYVATDDSRVRDVCVSHGIRVIMTSESCLTGTDRVAECAQQIDCDLFLNVQGDEPVFDPDDLRTLIAEAQAHPREVLNGFCDLQESQFRDTSIPKVVMRQDGRLLYMSRAAVPSTKTGDFVAGWRQVCCYSFPREALAMFSRAKSKTRLEAIEDIEILRFLELGWEVRMVPMSDSSCAVDLPEHVAEVERLIVQRGL